LSTNNWAFFVQNVVKHTLYRFGLRFRLGDFGRLSPDHSYGIGQLLCCQMSVNLGAGSAFVVKYCPNCIELHALLNHLTSCAVAVVVKAVLA
jgi:hypothetical protein